LYLFEQARKEKFVSTVYKHNISPSTILERDIRVSRDSSSSSAISNMCHNVGAMILGEGVESRDETLACVDNVGKQHKFALKEAIGQKQALIEGLRELAEKVLAKLRTSGVRDLSAAKESIFKNKKIEAAYVIDASSGIQIGDTLINAKERYLYAPSKGWQRP
jgi:hypothetical protein